MGYRTLIETWVGMSWEEITDNWKPPAKKEDYEAAVEEKNKLANAILEGIIKRAQAGELDAVNWLRSVVSSSSQVGKCPRQARQPSSLASHKKSSGRQKSSSKRLPRLPRRSTTLGWPASF